MEELYTSELVSLGIALTQLAVKGTATAVSNKIKAIKNEKDINNVKKTYDEIVNELLAERDEAVRIAQSYKSELDKVVISDEDITHLHNTVSSILDIIKNYELSNSKGNGTEEEEVENKYDAYEQIKELISVDTLKTMQLIGFN